MTSTTFYERRQPDLSVDIVNRRAANRRNRHTSYLPERRRLVSQVRRHERESFKIPVCLQIEGRGLSGYTHDISSEGLQVFCGTVLKPGTPVALRFSFGEQVCYLNITGQVVASRQLQDNGSISRTLGIKFTAIKEWEQKTLIAIVKEVKKKTGTRERSLLTILVAEDALALKTAEFYNRTLSLKSGKGRGIDESDEFCDRRFASRITTTITAILEFKDPTTNEPCKLSCNAINLSTGGASLTFRNLVSVPMDVNLQLFFPSNPEPSNVIGRMVWNHCKIFDSLSKESLFKYGIQFTTMEDQVQNELGQFISRHILSRERLCERRTRTTIVSELINFKNRDGRWIVGFYDHLKDYDAENPFVIIPPGYGQTKKEGLSISYYLVKNGFNVIRYDNTDHVGESAGEIFDTTMIKMKSDLLSAIDHVNKFGCKQIGVVASSLAARAAIKAAAEDKRIDLLVCLVPVVDVQNTLRVVYNKDIIATCLRDRNWVSTNILGFEVSRNFVDTAISDEFTDLQSTIQDLNGLNIPAVFFASEKDAWINLEDVKTAFQSLATLKKELFVISDAMHRFDENPGLANKILSGVVQSSLKYLCNVETADITVPNTREIAIQNRLERERYKSFEKLQSHNERDFWCKYLNRYKHIVNFHDYWHLLDTVNDFLGTVKVGETILDAGCGNGSFGAFLLVHTMYKTKDTLFQKSLPLFSYVGLDFVESALEEARAVYEKLHLEFIEKLGRRHLVTCYHLLADLNNQLTFKNDSFDKICCNLVISYLQNPLFALRELVRVLKPRGRLVITSLKPNADLTEIYRNFVKVAESNEEIDEAWKLLNNAGAIKCKEAEGHYHFFSESELAMMMTIAGAKKIQTCKVLANQATLIMAEKE